MGQSCSRNDVGTEKLHLLLSLCLSEEGLGTDKSARLQSQGQLSYSELSLCWEQPPAVRGQVRQEISPSFSCWAYRILCPKEIPVGAAEQPLLS